MFDLRHTHTCGLIVDQDDRVRTPAFRLENQVKHDPDELEDRAQNLDQSDDAEFRGIDEDIDSCLLHPDASHSFDCRVRTDFPDVCGKTRSIEITGGFPRDNPDQRRC